MANRSAEPIAWLAFSAGGVVAAVFAPVLLFVFGFALPFGWISPDYAHLTDVLGHPLTRIVLLGICVAALLHFAHRFRYTLEDGLLLGRFDSVIAVGCYGLALIGSVAAIYVFVFAL